MMLVAQMTLVFGQTANKFIRFRLRKQCPFCQVVQVTLIAEFFILIPLLGLISILHVGLLRLAVFFVLVTMVMILYKSYFIIAYRFPRQYKVNDIEYFK